MTSRASHIAFANARCMSKPERVDAFGAAPRHQAIVVASVANRRTDIARELVRKLVDRIETISADQDAFDHFRELLDPVIAGPEQVDVLIATFDDETVSVLSSPGVKCFRSRGGAVETVTSSAPGLVHTTHELGSEGAFAICTGGVYTTVSEAAIGEALRDHFYPRDVAWALVDAGRRGQPRSDLTAIVLRPSLLRAEDGSEHPAR